MSLSVVYTRNVYVEGHGLGFNREYKNFWYELADCLQEVDLERELWQAINLLRVVITAGRVEAEWNPASMSYVTPKNGKILTCSKTSESRNVCAICCV